MNRPDPPKQQPTAEPQKPQKPESPEEPEKLDKPAPQPPARQARGPITSERDVRRFEFLYRRLPTSARIAHVLVTSPGRHLVHWPDKQPTIGELLWSGIRTVYEIDVGIHVTQIVATPPSHGDNATFRADIDMIWRVVDPSKVVLTGLGNVQQAVSPSLLCQLRTITRQYKITELEKAEEAANERLRHSTLGAEFGLALEVFIRLAMDEASLSGVAIQQKVELFRKIISAGDFNQFALELALKPDDIDTVVRLLVAERDSHRQAVFDFVTRLLESDALDRWQIDDQVRTTLQWLRDSGYKVLAGSDEARKFSYGDNHREPIGVHDNGSGPP